MKKHVLIWMLAGALSFIAAPATAKEGLYLGAGLVYSDQVGSFVKNRYDASIGPEFRIGVSFGSIALEGNFLTVDHEGTGFIADADFKGLSIDLRISFSQQHDPTQVYLLAGLGSYSLKDFSGELKSELGDINVNLGLGLEHFFNDQVALDIRGVYRFIEYDEFNGTPLLTEVKGSALTIGAGLNLYF